MTNCPGLPRTKAGGVLEYWIFDFKTGTVPGKLGQVGDPGRKCSLAVQRWEMRCRAREGPS